VFDQGLNPSQPAVDLVTFLFNAFLDSCDEKWNLNDFLRLLNHKQIMLKNWTYSIVTNVYTVYEFVVGFY
jgi:hypothetical protein